MIERIAKNRNLSCRRMLLLGLIGCLFAGGFCNNQSMAECGSYVIIGNKAKLKELRAKGYLPKAMDNHQVASERKAAKSDAETNDSTDNSNAFKQWIPLTQRPCSGPNCDRNLPSPNIPKTPAPVPPTCKPVMRASRLMHKADGCIGFAGYFCTNETPISTISELDRPPE